MSQPDGIHRYECPVCKRLTAGDELLDNAGLCAMCNKQKTDIVVDNCPLEEREIEDDREED